MPNWLWFTFLGISRLRRRPGLRGKLPRVQRNQFVFKSLKWALGLWKLDPSFGRPLLVEQQVAPSVLACLDFWLQLGKSYDWMVLSLWLKMWYPCTASITTRLSMHVIICDLLGQRSRSFGVIEKYILQKIWLLGPLSMCVMLQSLRIKMSTYLC